MGTNQTQIITGPCTKIKGHSLNIVLVPMGQNAYNSNGGA